MLLDLLEHLEKYIVLIQSNTDGLIVQVKDENNIEKFREICHEWEKRTGMGLGFDEIDEIYQKDVNNYVFRFTSGKLERKGAYVMELDDLNYDLPIVNKAIVDYLMSGIYPEETINNCNVLKDFQKIIKISSNYKLGWHNGNYLNDKTFRVFASKNKSDSYIGKCRDVGETIEKFANTPEHCFIYNDNVNGLKVDESLDKRWYINLAEKRLNDFGIDLNEDSLF
jgi:DNA polymerase